MRQGKLSELIHNSAKFPNLTECSVEVHFRDIIDLVCDSVLSYDAPLTSHSLGRTRLRSFLTRSSS